jgi:hypothetical protein
MRITEYIRQDDNKQPAALSMDVNDTPWNTLASNADARSTQSRRLPAHAPQSALPSGPLTALATRILKNDLPFAVGVSLVDRRNPNEASEDSRRDPKHFVEEDAIGQAKDLTAEIKLVQPDAVSYGGCSDIYHGKWVQQREVGSTGRTILVCSVLVRSRLVVTSPPPGCIEGSAYVEREEGPDAVEKGEQYVYEWRESRCITDMSASE